MPESGPERRALIDKAVQLERDAHRLLAQKEFDPAFDSFQSAARLFEQAGEDRPAAATYRFAASCWDIKTGKQPLKYAANCDELAGHAAMRAGDFSYARGCFREAAMLFEQEGDYERYSRCYRLNKAADRHHSLEILLRGKGSLKERALAAGHWVVNVAGSLLWGHGEMPHRTSLSALFVILFMAVVYWWSDLLEIKGVVRDINFWEALYFSVITFSTVGYGDFLPTGWVRIFASIEALSGIVLAPLFLIGLQRRYLRIHR